MQKFITLAHLLLLQFNIKGLKAFLSLFYIF